MTERTGGAKRRVLVTGASGFVGRHLCPLLEALGYEIVRASRKPPRGRGWIQLDVNHKASLESALAGVDTAFFLVHQLQGADDSYPTREAEAARNFGRSARAVGVRRVVYLGGVCPTLGENADRGPSPAHQVSRHLAARLETGRILRKEAPRCIELRAAMIVGAGGLSWNVVRDLVHNLPVMLLPRWLARSSWPVAIDDVVKALAACIDCPADHALCFDLPGAERVTHREVMDRTAALWNKRRFALALPVMTPTLSSYWITAFSRAPLRECRELVQGLRWNLDLTKDRFWDGVKAQPMSLKRAIQLALTDERESSHNPGPQAVKRLRALEVPRWRGAPVSATVSSFVPLVSAPS